MSTLASVIIYDLFANRPAFGIPGRLFFASDTGVEYYDTGSAWQAVTGGMVLLEQHTASSSADLHLTASITSAYDEYIIELEQITPATNAVSIIMEVSSDGGSTWIAGSNYTWAALRQTYSPNAGAGNNTGTSSWDLTVGSTCGSLTAGGGISGSYRLYNPLGMAQYPRLNGQGTYYQDTTYVDVVGLFGGKYTGGAAINAVRVRASSGNLASGIIRCYGLSK